MTMKSNYSELVLRVDAWEAVNVVLNAAILGLPVVIDRRQKALIEVARESITVAIKTPLPVTDARSIA